VLRDTLGDLRIGLRQAEGSRVEKLVRSGCPRTKRRTDELGDSAHAVIKLQLSSKGCDCSGAEPAFVRTGRKVGAPGLSARPSSPTGGSLLFRGRALQLSLRLHLFQSSPTVINTSSTAHATTHPLGPLCHPPSPLVPSRRTTHPHKHIVRDAARLSLRAGPARREHHRRSGSISGSGEHQRRCCCCCSCCCCCCCRARRRARRRGPPRLPQERGRPLRVAAQRRQL
jgi:hypothetical protein